VIDSSTMNTRRMPRHQTELRIITIRLHCECYCWQMTMVVVISLVVGMSLLTSGWQRMSKLYGGRRQESNSPLTLHTYLWDGSMALENVPRPTEDLYFHQPLTKLIAWGRRVVDHGVHFSERDAQELSSAIHLSSLQMTFSGLCLAARSPRKLPCGPVATPNSPFLLLFCRTGCKKT